MQGRYRRTSSPSIKEFQIGCGLWILYVLPAGTQITREPVLVADRRQSPRAWLHHGISVP